MRTLPSKIRVQPKSKAGEEGKESKKSEKIKRASCKTKKVPNKSAGADVQRSYQFEPPEPEEYEGEEFEDQYWV